MSEEQKIQQPIKPNYFCNLNQKEIDSWVSTLFNGNLGPVDFSLLPPSEILQIENEIKTYHQLIDYLPYVKSSNKTILKIPGESGEDEVRDLIHDYSHFLSNDDHINKQIGELQILNGKSVNPPQYLNEQGQRIFQRKWKPDKFLQYIEQGNENQIKEELKIVKHVLELKPYTSQDDLAKINWYSPVGRGLLQSIMYLYCYDENFNRYFDASWVCNGQVVYTAFKKQNGDFVLGPHHTIFQNDSLLSLQDAIDFQKFTYKFYRLAIHLKNIKF